MPRTDRIYSIRTIYLDYKKEKKSKGEEFCNFKTFSTILYNFNKKLIKYMFDGKVVELPFGLSEFSIKKNKGDLGNLPNDYGTYRKEGIKAKHINEHSDGFIAKFHWNNKRCMIRGKSLFRFVPSYANKRKLAVIMKTPGGHKRFEA